MSEFDLYFQLGREHILDIKGYDHILFVVALCSLYQLKHWKNVLILVTAFTIGHSITLALSTFNIVQLDKNLIELLIPITILITALMNIIVGPGGKNNNTKLNYFFALFFGLIHGLGFSNYLKALLGGEDSVLVQLFSFNLGIELGQIVIVVAFLMLGFILTDVLNVSRRDWNLAVSSGVAAVAITLMI
jgi:hypothetical protein